MSAKPAAATPGAPPVDELKFALRQPRVHYAQAIRLSLVIGVLALAPSWFMFEVYGRVLNSRNEHTLVWLLVAAIGSYIVLELLEVVRHAALHRAGHQVEELLTSRVFEATFTANLRRIPGANAQGLSDLRTVADFVGSPVITGLMDLPAALLCLVLLYVMSPWLALLALAAAAIHAAIGWYQERNSARPFGEATRASGEAQLRAAGTFRNAQVIEAMGMAKAMHKRWMDSQNRFMLKLGQASDSAGSTSAASKMLMQLQSSLLLGLAVWLALNNALLGGAAMAIVASILGGRVLSPLAQLIAQWRAIGNMRSAYTRLKALLAAVPPGSSGMSLPAPKGVILAENIIVAPPGAPQPVLKGLNFVALPSEMLTIIGSSAAGKSTLARALVGVWPSQGGKVRLDGADVFTWDKTELGPHIGYLPQGVELFDGTVAENIARFGSVDMARVREAADEVGITAMIEALPEGFDTQIGDDGAILSGGQRQRLGLARAVYGQPKLLVLDEPNSSLDEAGERALLELIKRMKERGTTIVSITHRMAMLAAADRLLVLNEGQVVHFGLRDEVLLALKTANEQARARAQGRPAPQVVSAARGGPAAPPAGLQPQGARS